MVSTASASNAQPYLGTTDSSAQNWLAELTP